MANSSPQGENICFLMVLSTLFPALASILSVQIVLKALSAKIQGPGKERRSDGKAQRILTIALGAMVLSCARAPLLRACSAVPEIGCELVEVYEGASYQAPAHRCPRLSTWSRSRHSQVPWESVCCFCFTRVSLYSEEALSPESQPIRHKSSQELSDL